MNDFKKVPPIVWVVLAVTVGFAIFHFYENSKSVRNNSRSGKGIPRTNTQQNQYANSVSASLNPALGYLPSLAVECPDHEAPTYYANKLVLNIRTPIQIPQTQEATQVQQPNQDSQSGTYNPQPKPWVQPSTGSMTTSTSNGPSVIVPNVVGQRLATATGLLTAAGLKEGGANQVSGVSQTVVTQNPAAGTSVTPGSMVTLRTDYGS